MSNPATVCDLLKLLRTEWLSVGGLAEHMGMDVATASRWMREMADQGLLLKKTGERTTRTGKPPTVYTLAPAWGGAAP